MLYYRHLQSQDHIIPVIVFKEFTWKMKDTQEQLQGKTITPVI